MPARSSYERQPGQDEPQFQALVDQYYGPLFRFAMSLTRSEADSADLVQDTFLTWASKGHQLLDPSKAKGWLFTSLHRNFLQSQRRVARFPHHEISSVDEELPTVDPGILTTLDAQSVLDLLASIDPQYKAAVALFYLEDYSYNEIASVLEIPLGTVKSRIARGLAQLKQLILRSPRLRMSFKKEGL